MKATKLGSTFPTQTSLPSVRLAPPTATAPTDAPSVHQPHLLTSPLGPPAPSALGKQTNLVQSEPRHLQPPITAPPSSAPAPVTQKVPQGPTPGASTSRKVAGPCPPQAPQDPARSLAQAPQDPARSLAQAHLITNPSASAPTPELPVLAHLPGPTSSALQPTPLQSLGPRLLRGPLASPVPLPLSDVPLPEARRSSAWSTVPPHRRSSSIRSTVSAPITPHLPPIEATPLSRPTPTREASEPSPLSPPPRKFPPPHHNRLVRINSPKPDTVSPRTPPASRPFFCFIRPPFLRWFINYHVNRR